MNKTTLIGGTMYGDGEYVCSFHDVSSTWCPTSALLLCPSGNTYTIQLEDGEKPNVKLAARFILLARTKEGTLS